jgi:hypothetical protein
MHGSGEDRTYLVRADGRCKKYAHFLNVRFRQHQLAQPLRMDKDLPLAMECTPKQRTNADRVFAASTGNYFTLENMAFLAQ